MKNKKTKKVMQDDSLSTRERKQVNAWWIHHNTGKSKYVHLVYELGGIKPVYGKPSKTARAGIKIAHSKIRKELKRKGVKVSVINSTLSRYCVLSFGYPLQVQTHVKRPVVRDGGQYTVDIDGKAWQAEVRTLIRALMSKHDKAAVQAVVDIAFNGFGK